MLCNFFKKHIVHIFLIYAETALKMVYDINLPDRDFFMTVNFYIFYLLQSEAALPEKYIERTWHDKINDFYNKNNLILLKLHIKILRRQYFSEKIENKNIFLQKLLTK